MGSFARRFTRTWNAAHTHASDMKWEPSQERSSTRARQSSLPAGREAGHPSCPADMDNTLVGSAFEYDVTAICSKYA